MLIEKLQNVTALIFWNVFDIPSEVWINVKNLTSIVWVSNHYWMFSNQMGLFVVFGYRRVKRNIGIMKCSLTI